MKSSGIIDVAIKVALIAAIIILFFMNKTGKQSFAYVDSQKVLNGYKGMEDAVKEYQIQVAAWNSRLDTLKAELNDLKVSVSHASGENRKSLESSIAIKENEYRSYESVLKDKIYEADKLLTKGVMDKMNDFLKRYGESKNYSIILGATQYGNIVYAKEGLDITADVIRLLNEEYKK